MRTAIVQSNYIPWRGYFDIIGNVDLFIFFDDRQFTIRDWRNRNRIKTPNGAEWLTIPCGADRNRRIDEVRIDGQDWQPAHWRRIQQCYGKSPFWRDYRDFFAAFYLDRTWTHLSALNQALIGAISADIFGFSTQFAVSSQLGGTGSKDDLLLDLCRKTNTDVYVSGPSARHYLREPIFTRHNISVQWMDYSGYPEYPQLWGAFIPDVSVLDLIFNTGPQARLMLNRTGS